MNNFFYAIINAQRVVNNDKVPIAKAKRASFLEKIKNI